jgi:lipoate-protein ligase A
MGVCKEEKVMVFYRKTTVIIGRIQPPGKKVTLEYKEEKGKLCFSVNLTTRHKNFGCCV